MQRGPIPPPSNQNLFLLLVHLPPTICLSLNYGGSRGFKPGVPNTVPAGAMAPAEGI